MIGPMSDFSAVTTTGIYCLPECSARPLARNVRHYSTAAAAEAQGFRACMRCRPYRTEQPLGWSAPEMVCRAVQLILDGALDGATEHELGSRVGMSPRHLRRLFDEHLGVSPDQLARSRRAHFARRLLDDTDLSVGAIASASGFGSTRQMGRACSEIFRAPPSELRARRRSSDRLAADGGLTLRLPYRGPLDWEAMLGYFRVRAIAGVEHVEGHTYRRTVRIDGDPGVIELTRGSPDDLLMRIHLPHWRGLIHHVQRARRIFNLDTDIEGANEALREKPIIGSLIEDRPGLRTPGTWDPFETGVRAILGQQVSVLGANTLIARLVERCGTPVRGLARIGLTHLFPSPVELAVAKLEGLGLTGARAQAVKEFALAVHERRIELDRSRPLEQFLQTITAIPGLGPWTAHYIALRLGEPDAFPASDLGIRRALEVAPGAGVSGRDAEKLAEAWRPHRALAATHLWLAGSGEAVQREALRDDRGRVRRGTPAHAADAEEAGTRGPRTAARRTPR
jgi:AraC family transcriptional regulator of adaptative response / DNA-3-methyladenine glycosylase II